MNFKKDNRGLAKQTLVIIIAIVAALAIGAGVFASTMFKKDPFTRLMAGYMKLYSQREQKYTADVSFSMDKENPEVKKAFDQIPEGALKSSKDQIMDFVSKVLPKIGLKYSAIVGTKEEPVNMGAKFELLYDNKELADAGMTVRPWEVTVFSKTLLDKPLYMDVKDNVNKLSGLDISSIKLKDYIDVFYEDDEFIKKIADSKYFEILKDRLKENLAAEGSNKVVLNLKYKDAIRITEEMCKAGAKDEELKNFAIRKFDKIVEVAIKNGDYKLLGFSEEDFKKQAEDAKKALSDNWETILNGLSNAYSSEEMNQYVDMMENVPIKYTFTFSGDEIVKIEGNLTTNGVGVNFAVNVEKYDTDGFTFGNSSDSNNMADMDGDSIKKTLIGKANDILISDAYKNMEDDIIKTAKESLAEEDAANIETGLKQLQMLIGLAGYAN